MALTRVTASAGLLLVCTDRVLRLAAKTASQRDDWVEALNMNLVRSHIILKGSEMGLVRMRAVRSKADSPPMWSMYTLYLHGYDVELFERCASVLL